MESIVQFLTVIVIFAFVLFITWFTTRWIGNYQKTRMKGVNIELFEAVRLSPGQYIQILRIGSRYMAVAVSKDNVTLLCELDESELALNDRDNAVFPADSGESFKRLLDKARSAFDRGQDKK